MGNSHLECSSHEHRRSTVVEGYADRTASFAPNAPVVHWSAPFRRGALPLQPICEGTTAQILSSPFPACTHRDWPPPSERSELAAVQGMYLSLAQEDHRSDPERSIGTRSLFWRITGTPVLICIVLPNRPSSGSS